MPSEEDYEPRSRRSRPSKYRYDDSDAGDDLSDEPVRAPSPPRRSRREESSDYGSSRPRPRARRDPQRQTTEAPRYKDPRDIEPMDDKYEPKLKRRGTYDDEDDLPPKTSKPKDVAPRRRGGYEDDDDRGSHDPQPTHRHHAKEPAQPPEDFIRKRDYDDIPPRKNEGRRRNTINDDFVPLSRKDIGKGGDRYDDPPPPRHKDRGSRRNRYDDDDDGGNIHPATLAAAGAGVGAGAVGGAAAARKYIRHPEEDDSRGSRSDRDKARDRDRDRGYKSDNAIAKPSRRTRDYDDDPYDRDRGHRSSRRDRDRGHDERDFAPPRRSKTSHDDLDDHSHSRGYASDRPSRSHRDERERDPYTRSSGGRSKHDDRYRDDRGSGRSRDRDRDRDSDRDSSRRRRTKKSGLGGLKFDPESLGRYVETGQKHYKTFKPIIDSMAKMYMDSRK